MNEIHFVSLKATTSESVSTWHRVSIKNDLILQLKLHGSIESFAQYGDKGMTRTKNFSNRSSPRGDEFVLSDLRIMAGLGDPSDESTKHQMVLAYKEA